MASFKHVGRFLQRFHGDAHRLTTLSSLRLSSTVAQPATKHAPASEEYAPWPHNLSNSVSSPATKNVSVRVEDGIAIVTLDDPNAKVNSLSMQVQKELSEAMQSVWNNDAVKGGVLISGKPGCFIAGADIKMLQACKTASEVEALSAAGQELLNKVAASPKPIVAAIKGSCLGGGLEVALACQYRLAVMDKKTVMALPEVMLGLLPGAGGTQRLPKTVALTDALPMMLQGKKNPG